MFTCEGLGSVSFDQLVTIYTVGMWLKGEVLDSKNAKRTNNLHGGVSTECSHVKG